LIKTQNVSSLIMLKLYIATYQNYIDPKTKSMMNTNAKNIQKNSKYAQLIDGVDEEINFLSMNENNLNQLRQSATNLAYQCDFGCHFDKQSEAEIEKARKARKKLLLASAFCVLFMIAELVGGFLAGSIALMSDALHLLSDCGGLMISVVALWMSQKEATNKLTYGYHRAEIVGALFSVFLIWGLTIWLVYEAITRILAPEHVDGKIMFIVACCGICVNIAMSKILHQGHGHHHHGHDHGHGHGHGHGHSHDHDHDHDHDDDEQEKGHVHSHHDHMSVSHDAAADDCKAVEAVVHSHSHSHHDHGAHNNNQQQPRKRKHSHSHTNVNVRAAFIHAIGDLLQSIGVLIAAALIWYDEETFRIADPICTLIFSVIVLFTTVNLMRDLLSVLMESVPSNLDYTEIALALKRLTDVAQVHDLHVWNLSLGKPSLSVHLLVRSSTLDDDGKIIPACADAILRNAQNVLQKKFKISHTTIQIEWPHDDTNEERSCPSYCDNHRRKENEDGDADSDENGHHHHHHHASHSHEHHHSHSHSHGHGAHDDHSHEHEHTHSHPDPSHHSLVGSDGPGEDAEDFEIAKAIATKPYSKSKEAKHKNNGYVVNEADDSNR